MGSLRSSTLALAERRKPRSAPRRGRRHCSGRRDVREGDGDQPVPGLDRALGLVALAKVAHGIRVAAFDAPPHRHPSAKRGLPDEVDWVVHGRRAVMTTAPMLSR